MQRAEQVYRHDPLGDVLRFFGQRADRHDSGIVHEDVDRAEGRFDGA
jgi:hypothetical protein